ncbi:MAG TPA: cytochrome c [Solirubrobacterales bacterium]|nr:cytochrome c [Solirubrobacterales bacterium]
MARAPKLISPLLALMALIALVVVASGCGTTDADPQRGRELFRVKCGVCHSLAQAGSTAQVGPNLDHAFAAARAEGNDSDTIEGVVKAQVEYPRPSNGNSAVSMPADIVTGQDLDDVAAYVGEWAGVPGAAPPKVPGGPGAQVFANNGCGNCHVFAAAESGGVTGPNLDEYLAPDDDAAAIEEMIVEPNAEIAKGYPPNVMPPNFGELLSTQELEDLVQYLIENSPAGGNAKG